jgi:polysaccharide deacetylase family protein (PEP-CTERM system associated)
MLNVLTIDVEDYYHVSAFERHIKPDDWINYQARVGDNTRTLLDILDERQVRATFFILGWIAQREPGLVKDIHARGHEIASHGYWHKRVTTQVREAFADDLRRSKSLLEDLIGEAVHGYRAPSYSIAQNSLWAFDELLEAGFTYDSSVFPVRHDFYGIPDWPRFPFRIVKTDDGQWSPAPISSQYLPGLLEIPITTLRIFNKNIPISGGGYFRFFPFCVTKWGLKRLNEQEERPFVFYLHPWEIDPTQPRIHNIPLKSKCRHYLNLDKTKTRFERLISCFNFTSIRCMIPHWHCSDMNR